MAWDEHDFTREWERREHAIRQEIANLRTAQREADWKEIHEELQGQYQRQVDWLNNALEEQQKYIITIHELPLIGGWIRKWAEKRGQQETT
jgi:predicted glycoside hydrolase/deacetylase ChbG (UPF0249 family)